MTKGNRPVRAASSGAKRGSVLVPALQMARMETEQLRGMRLLSTRAAMVLTAAIAPAAFAWSQCADACSGNLLVNPGFEITTPVCNTIPNGQLYTDQTPVQGWFGIAGVNSPQSGITPDNFNNNCFGNNTNNCGQGLGSLGFFTKVSAANGREYIQSQLLEPLEAGVEYCFRTQVKKGPTGTMQPNNGLGIWFTDQMVDVTAMNNGQSFLGAGSLINATAYWQLEDGDLINACTVRSGTFCAQGGETWIVIGNFRDDASMSIATGGGVNNGYLIVDDLSLTKVCPPNTTPLELLASTTQIPCGGSVTLQAQGGSGTLTWIPAIGTGAGPFTVSPTATTTYQVVSSALGTCGIMTDTASVTVVVDPCAHQVNVVAGSTCPGGCTEVYAELSDADQPPYTYLWSGGLPAGPGPHPVCPGATTTYTVIVTDVNGLGVTASATVTVLDPPLLTVQHTDVSCHGASDGTATVQPSGTGPFTHLWDSTPPQTASTASGLPAGTWTVTTTDALGCSATAQVTIGGPPPLTVTLVAVEPDCGEQNGSITAIPAGGVGPYFFGWNTVPPQSSATATGLGAGSYAVAVFDANGCLATMSMTLTAPGAGSLSVASTDATCANTADGQAVATMTGASEPVSYTWNTQPPQTGPIATGLSAGVWVVTATEANGCVSAQSVTIGAPQALNVTFQTTPATCGEANGSITAVVSGGTAPYEPIWNTMPMQTGTVASALAPGNWTVSITDAAGCTASFTTTVPDAPGPEAFFTANGGCTDVPIVFTSTSTGANDLHWDMGDGSTYTGPVVVHTYTEAGEWSVVLTAADETGCVDQFAATVTVVDVPQPDLLASPGSGCAPLAVDFAGIPQLPGLGCLWSFGDGSFSNDCSPPPHIYASPGCFDVSLTVSAEGCAATISYPQLVCVEPVPVASFSYTPQPVPPDDPRVRFQDLSTGAASWLWNFSAGDPATSMLPDPILDLWGMPPGTYEACLLVTSPAGCVDSLCRSIVLADELIVHVPNAFTPDGDGVNDLFLPVILGHDPEACELLIFNRWGETIFETRGKLEGWDGTVAGTPAPDGVYVWKLAARPAYSGFRRSFTGHLTLIR